MQPRRWQFSFTALLFFAIYVEGLAVKTVYFDGQDPIVFHYIFSVASITLMCLILGVSRHGRAAGRLATGTSVFCAIILWLFLLLPFRADVGMEFVALCSFILLVSFFYFLFPFASESVGVSPRLIILISFVAVVFGSALTLIFDSDSGYDPSSSRFRGMLISVAVACNVFFFACVYFAWAYKYSKLAYRWVHLALCLVSLAFLFMTVSRMNMLNATLALAVLAVTSREGNIRWLRAALCALAVAVLSATVAVWVGVDSLSETLRVSDGNILASRDGLWLEGMARASENSFSGTGLLTKQTSGGTQDIALDGSGYYSPYDAHSLLITLTEQGGLVFMVLMFTLMALPLIRLVRTCGLKHALQMPEFLIMAISLPSMAATGGDMVSLGSWINRLQWIFLGIISFVALAGQQKRRFAL